MRRHIPNLLTILRCVAALGVAIALGAHLSVNTPAPSTDAAFERFQPRLLEDVLIPGDSDAGPTYRSAESLADRLRARGVPDDEIPEWTEDQFGEIDGSGRDVRPETDPPDEINFNPLMRDRLLTSLPARHPTQIWAWLALVLFLAAAITDFLDGWLARRWDVMSRFGRLLDPIADKLLVGLPFIVLMAFALRGGMTALSGAVILPMLVIVMRDVSVTVLRFSRWGGAKVEVAHLSKIKTALELGLLGLLLAAMAFVWPVTLPIALVWLAALYVAAALSAVTGWRYFRAAFGV